MQAKSPIRQRPKESNGVALLGAKESEERRATSGMDEEDKRSVDDALKLVRRDYVELITIWNSIGLAAEKKQAESLLLHQEIEELFKRRLMDLAKFKEEMEREIASLHTAVSELRALLPDLDIDKLCGKHDPKAHLYVQMEQLRAIRDALQAAREERLRAMREIQSRFLVLCEELRWKNEAEVADRNHKTEGEDDEESNGVEFSGRREDEGRLLPADFFLPAEHDLSDARLARFKGKVAEGDKELDELKKLVAPLKRDIAKLWQELYITPDSTDELDNFVVGRQPCTSIEKLRTFDVVCRLRHKKSDLEEERDRRRKALDKAMDHIHELWAMLKINEDDEDRRKFIARKDALPAYSAPQIAVCKEEQMRLEKISESKIKEMIEDERNRLKDLWKQLHMSDQQIQDFLDSLAKSGAGKYSFDVLEAMRVEVKTLTERLARMGPLIKLIVRREWIKSEMRAFETKASEKSRLFGRSTQLLEEEKFRKIVAHEFPRLTEKLKKGLVKYESKYTERFVFQGKRYLKTMQEEQQQPNFALLHLKLFSGSGKEEAPVNKQNLMGMITMQKKEKPPPESTAAVEQHVPAQFPHAGSSSRVPTKHPTSSKAPPKTTSSSSSTSSSTSRTKDAAPSAFSPPTSPPRSTTTSTSTSSKPFSSSSSSVRTKPPANKADTTKPKPPSREENVSNGSKATTSAGDRRASALNSSLSGSGVLSTPGRPSSRATIDVRSTLSGSSSATPSAASRSRGAAAVAATPLRDSSKRVPATPSRTTSSRADPAATPARTTSSRTAVGIGKPPENGAESTTPSSSSSSRLNRSLSSRTVRNNN